MLSGEQFIVDAEDCAYVVSQYHSCPDVSDRQQADALLDLAAPDLYEALEITNAYEEIRFAGTLSDEYHTLIAPWLKTIEELIGPEVPMSERFPGWHRDAMYLLSSRLRAAALTKARGEAL
jgi:hypothetical protein